MNYPLVSVIVPVYNGERFIAATLDSVLAQSYPHLEVLVVDDGSSDSTAQIVQRYMAQDNRVVLLSQANGGVAVARNTGIQNAKGEYIAPLDADDIWYPQKLEKQVQCMLSSDPRVGLIYTWSTHIDEQSQLMGGWIAYRNEGEVYVDLAYRNFIGNGSNPLIRRSCLESVGYYSTEYKQQNAQGSEDWDLYLRIAERYQFRVIPEFLMGYRQVVGSMSTNYEVMERSHRLLMEDIRSRYPEVPAVLYRWSRSDFFYYLASLSKLSENYPKTRFWLSQAVQQDLYKLLHPGFYQMYLRSLVRSLFGKSKLAFQPLRAALRQELSLAYLSQRVKRQGHPWRDPYLRRLKHISYRVESSRNDPQRSIFTRLT